MFSTYRKMLKRNVKMLQLIKQSAYVIYEWPLSMKEFTLATIKSHGFNEIQKKREVAKLMLIDYYKDLKPKKKSCHRELLESFLVRYVWEDERQIIRVSQTESGSHGHWVPYGSSS